MWRLAVKIKGKYNEYVYKWEYFATYEELVNYLATHKLADGQHYEALLIGEFWRYE